MPSGYDEALLVERDESGLGTRRVVKVVAVVALAVGAAAALGTFVVRDQITRSRRDLFSAHPLRRLAALTFISGRTATIDLVQLLRDFIAWESRPLIRKRAVHVLDRMEEDLSRANAGTATG